MTVNPYEIFKRELRIMGTFALKKTFGKALRLVRSGKLNMGILVDRKLELDQVPELFAEIKDGNKGLKVMIYPNGVVN